jgi:hypothetical protein
MFMPELRHSVLFRVVAVVTVLTFLPLQSGFGQTLMTMPEPGRMVSSAGKFIPATMAGLELSPKEPFKFNFLINPGEEKLSDAAGRAEYMRIIKYFLAALTTPNTDMWVNLSPYEDSRIITDNFSQTEMGRDLLSQDYLLKQMTASLLYPENSAGKEFWAKVYQKAYAQYGTTDVAVDTFNKVWIVPDRSVVYERNGSGLLIDSHLKVMLEEDYFALDRNMARAVTGGNAAVRKTASLSSGVVREVIIPVLEEEVNEGKYFAPLRQIYSAMVMATWFKQSLRKSLLGEVYADRSKVAGINLGDPAGEKERIYEQYLAAYKVGVFNFVKEDLDPATQEPLPRKYFSGGARAPETVTIVSKLDNSQSSLARKGLFAALAVTVVLAAPTVGRVFRSLSGENTEIVDEGLTTDEQRAPLLEVQAGTTQVLPAGQPQMPSVMPILAAPGTGTVQPAAPSSLAAGAAVTPPVSSGPTRVTAFIEGHWRAEHQAKRALIVSGYAQDASLNQAEKDRLIKEYDDQRPPRIDIGPTQTFPGGKEQYMPMMGSLDAIRAELKGQPVALADLNARAAQINNPGGDFLVVLDITDQAGMKVYSLRAIPGEEPLEGLLSRPIVRLAPGTAPAAVVPPSSAPAPERQPAPAAGTQAGRQSLLSSALHTSFTERVQIPADPWMNMAPGRLPDGIVVGDWQVANPHTKLYEKRVFIPVLGLFGFSARMGEDGKLVPERGGYYMGGLVGPRQGPYSVDIPTPVSMRVVSENALILLGLIERFGWQTARPIPDVRRDIEEQGRRDPNSLWDVAVTSEGQGESKRFWINISPASAASGTSALKVSLDRRMSVDRVTAEGSAYQANVIPAGRIPRLSDEIGLAPDVRRKLPLAQDTGWQSSEARISGVKVPGLVQRRITVPVIGTFLFYGERGDEGAVRLLPGYEKQGWLETDPSGRIALKEGQWIMTTGMVNALWDNLLSVSWASQEGRSTWEQGRDKMPQQEGLWTVSSFKAAVNRDALAQNLKGGGEIFDFLMKNGFFQETEGKLGTPVLLTAEKKALLAGKYAPDEVKKIESIVQQIYDGELFMLDLDPVVDPVQVVFNMQGTREQLADAFARKGLNTLASAFEALEADPPETVYTMNYSEVLYVDPVHGVGRIPVLNIYPSGERPNDLYRATQWRRATGDDSRQLTDNEGNLLWEQFWHFGEPQKGKVLRVIYKMDGRMEQDGKVVHPGHLVRHMGFEPTPVAAVPSGLAFIRGDKAQTAGELPERDRAETPLGGIDLNETLMSMKIKRDKDGGILPFEAQDPSMIETLRSIQGFRPVIMDIRPVSLSSAPLFEELRDAAS